MCKNEFEFRVRWLWSVFKNWIYDVVTFKLPEGAIGVKRILTWELSTDNKVIEHHEGSFWEFVKWIFTHDTFNNL